MANQQGGGVSIVDRNVQTIRSVLQKGIDQLQLVMAKEMSADRMIRIACTMASRSPTLAKCTPQSVGLALINASLFGLEPNGRDAHLVPFWNSKLSRYEATFMPDYKGLVKLAYRSKLVTVFDAKCVRENDQFDFQYGSNQFLHHKPAMKERGEIIGAWALCQIKDAGETFVVLDQEAIEKRKQASQSGSKGSAPWQDWPDEMAAKSAVKVLSKMVPLGDEFEKVVNVDDAAEQGINVVPAQITIPELPSDEGADVGPAGAQQETAPQETAPVQTTAKAKTQKEKADELSEQIRQRSAASSAPQQQQTLPQAEPDAHPGADVLPADPLERGNDESEDDWVARMCETIKQQDKTADVDGTEMMVMRMGGGFMQPQHVSAIEAASKARKAALTTPAKQDPPAQQKSPQQSGPTSGGPPTKAESDAVFREVYQRMKDCKSAEELTQVLNEDPNLAEKLSGEDYDMLGKFHDRLVEGFKS